MNLLVISDKEVRIEGGEDEKINMTTMVVICGG